MAAVASTALAMVVVVKAEGLMVVVVEVGTERCSRRNRCQAHRQHIGFQARRRHKCCLKRMCMYFGTIPAQSVVAAPEAAGECTPAQGGKEAAHKGRMPCRTVRGDFSHRRCACACLAAVHSRRVFLFVRCGQKLHCEKYYKGDRQALPHRVIQKHTNTGARARLSVCVCGECGTCTLVTALQQT